ncbi:MAG: ankyrin repeat domain-containing protein [Legionella sp.]
MFFSNHLSSLKNIFRVKKHTQKDQEAFQILVNNLLSKACENGDLKNVHLWLECYSPTTLAHKLADDSYAILRKTCANGHVEVVRLLLSLYSAPELAKALAAILHEPLRLACLNGHHQVVELLLAHFTDKARQSALADAWYYVLRWASAKGHPKVVALLLNAYSDTRLQCALAMYSHEALNEACKNKHREVTELLLREYCHKAINIDFTKSPENVKEQLKKYLSNGPLKDQADILNLNTFSAALSKVATTLPKNHSAQVFSQTVLAADGYLRFFNCNQNENTKAAKHFFDIALRLPIDLQMILCKRLYGLSGEQIPLKNSECAFKEEFNAHCNQGFKVRSS